jgi:hypothetical protein
MKLASIALAVSCLLAGCGSTTPATPPPAPAGSPVAHVDASAPAFHGIRPPAGSGLTAPSASASPQPTPTPDPEAVRAAAAAGYLAASDANVQAWDKCTGKNKNCQVDPAGIWGQFAADLKKLAVPADTAADLHDLVRKVTKVQEWERKMSALLAAGSMADFYVAARHRRNAQSRMANAIDQVRSDLRLPALCRAGCPD